MTKEEMIEAIYEEVADGIYDSYSEDETIFPVMIGDVLDYLEKIKDKKELESTQYYSGLYDDVCIKWEYKRKPLEMQSDDCIKYIYNLIK